MKFQKFFLVDYGKEDLLNESWICSTVVVVVSSVGESIDVFVCVEMLHAVQQHQHRAGHWR